MTFFCAEVFNFPLILVAKVIKAQTILLIVDDRNQTGLQHPILCGIEQTFKNRILHPLPIVYALLCNLP